MRSLTAALLALGVAACVRNPVTGERQLSLVSSEQEIALGKEGAEQVRATMGVYDDPRARGYVQAIGMRMASASERPKLPWSFDVVDDPAVNAFALPGGPIFVTRGILTHLGSEAELAAVLGHEIGHVTARHSVEQISKAQLAQVGLGVGAILSPEVAQLGQLAGVGLQLLFLKYGRDAERQSDELGFKYMTGAGYDPREMPKVFATLKRASQVSGGGRVPEWLSTHPDPENREKKAGERAAKLSDPGKLRVDEEQYLRQIDGMVFGDDPRQGFFRDNLFLHPGMEFQIEFPRGWKTRNTAAAVVGVSPEQDAAVQLSVATGVSSPEDAMRKFFAQEGVKPLASGSLEAGRAAPFEAQTQQGVLRGYVAFTGLGKTTLQLLGLAPAQAMEKRDGEIRASMASFGPLRDRSAKDVKPARVKLVRLDRDMDLGEFQRQHPSNVDPKVLAVINGIDEKGTLRSGQIAKQVEGGVPPEKK